jgi:hypothetical protein
MPPAVPQPTAPRMFYLKLSVFPKIRRNTQMFP